MTPSGSYAVSPHGCATNNGSADNPMINDLEGQRMSECVRSLSSGAEPTSDPITLHPIVAEDVERQMREMELSRAKAAVSSRDYMINT